MIRILLFAALVQAQTSGFLTTDPAIPASMGGVLYIGDSYNGPAGLGPFVGAFLRSSVQGSFRSVSSCGSSPVHWVSSDYLTKCGYFECYGARCRSSETGRTPKLDSLLKAKPSLTVVGLGANMLNPAGRYDLSEAKSMAAKIAATGSRCIWFGPPQVAAKVTHPSNLERFVRDLSEAVKPCQFLRSDNKVARSQMSNDGLHPSQSGYKVWADRLIADMRAILRPNPRAAPHDVPASR